MIAAANADGHIDDRERENIQLQLQQLGFGSDSRALLETEIAKPLSARELSMEVKSTGTAAEVYLLSSLIVDEANEHERNYLDSLARELKIPQELRERLHQEREA